MTSKLTAEKLNARREYPLADEGGKLLLEKIFDLGTLTLDIRELVGDFNDILSLRGTSQAEYEEACKGKDEYHIGEMEAEWFTEVLNEGWVPDHANGKQKKYFPILEYVPGSGLRFHGYGYDSSHTYVGARLLLKSPELVRFAFEKFPHIYEKFYVSLPNKK